MSNAHRGTPKNIVLLVRRHRKQLRQADEDERLADVRGARPHEGRSARALRQRRRHLVVQAAGRARRRRSGWGLKRNVRTSTCSPAPTIGPATGIFAFGFSRGAFTIRVLIGLIADQGLITGAKGRELERQAKWAYRAYRRTVQRDRGDWSRRCAAIRDWLLRKARTRASRRIRQDGQRRRTVAFVGLWDTVDAYGLPIDEMTRGWDQWVWPLSMATTRIRTTSNKICHAIALDDERHTFHPVLLDESRPKPAATTSTRSA